MSNRCEQPAALHEYGPEAALVSIGRGRLGEEGEAVVVSVSEVMNLMVSGWLPSLLVESIDGSGAGNSGLDELCILLLGRRED